MGIQLKRVLLQQKEQLININKQSKTLIPPADNNVKPLINKYKLHM